jgi:hypothetical protein
MGESLEQPAADITNVMRFPGRELQRLSSFEKQVRLTIELRDGLSLEDIGTFNARMSMPARSAARLKFSNYAHRLVAWREVDRL